MTALEDTMSGLPEDDNLKKMLTERDFLNIEAMENVVHGRYNITIFTL